MIKKLLVLPILATLCVVVGCGGDNAASGDSGAENQAESNVTAAERDAFVGTWVGKYSGLKDEMIVEAGAADHEVVITLHAKYENPDKVNGKLLSATKIIVAEQSMGGSPGTAEITMEDGKLSLTQNGMGITLEGEGYEKQ